MRLLRENTQRCCVFCLSPGPRAAFRTLPVAHRASLAQPCCPATGTRLLVENTQPCCMFSRTALGPSSELSSCASRELRATLLPSRGSAPFRGHTAPRPPSEHSELCITRAPRDLLPSNKSASFREEHAALLPVQPPGAQAAFRTFTSCASRELRTTLLPSSRGASFRAEHAALLRVLPHGPRAAFRSSRAARRASSARPCCLAAGARLSAQNTQRCCLFCRMALGPPFELHELRIAQAPRYLAA